MADQGKVAQLGIDCTRSSPYKNVIASKPKAPRVGIFGLGYVGLTTTACLLAKDIPVEGYEISITKRRLLARGRCPIMEPGVSACLQTGWGKGLFRVASFLNPKRLPDIIFICVGTPNDKSGATDLTFVHHVFAQLAEFNLNHPDFSSDIVLRSTIPPGTLADLQHRHPQLFARVPVGFYPEFLREGTAMADFIHPPQTVIGLLQETLRPRHLPRLLKHLGLSKNTVFTTANSAESLKFACNAFHAIKVCFANEVGRWVSASGGNAEEVMQLFRRDTRLNLSGRYLQPGTPYGGSCLPKDMRALSHFSNRLGIKLNLIQGCESSNKSHLEHLVRIVRRFRPRVVAILGVAFKKETDDVRGSPSLELMARLARGRTRIQAHDFLVHRRAVLGVNKKVLDRLITATAVTIHDDLAKVLRGADLVVIMHRDDRYHRAAERLTIPVLDIGRWQGF